jgi:hypothetical protein
MKRKRTAQRKVLKGLSVKAREFMAETFTDDIKREIEALMKTLSDKEQIVKSLDAEILDVIKVEEIEQDVDEATNFEVETSKAISEINSYLKKHTSAEVSELSFSSRFSEKPKVNLPKIIIKKFNGNPILWQQFYDTFDATINKCEQLSDIQKFTYLQGYLEGPALKCIEGMTLSNENYIQALKLLKERYGNPQLVISSHMSKLLKLEKVNNSKNVKELRNLYDRIESHVRSLFTVGITSEHYGPLLIPVVLEKIPEDIRLEISRKLGTDNWKMDEFMTILREETVARESCEFMKGKGDTEFQENKNKGFTTQNLYAGTRNTKCSFCKQNHFSDKCTVVTDLQKQKEIVWKDRLCFKCLNSGHSIRSCRVNNKCFACKSVHHHTAICEGKEGKFLPPIEPTIRTPHENSSTALVTSKTSVLLQTATTFVSDNYEKRRLPVKVLMDPGSQRTYLSQRLADYLQLVPIGKQSMTIKTFGNNAEQTMVLNEYDFCLKGMNGGQNVYVKGFSVPLVCSPLSGQRLNIVKEMFPCLKGLELADQGAGDSEIDLLIGADYYWHIIDGEVKRLNSEGLMAVKSKFGWLLSGPFDVTKSKDRCSMNLNSVHVLRVTVETGGNDPLEEEIKRFWDLDTLGIVDKEKSVYENFSDEIRFHDNRYEVHLPFKEDHPIIEDNYQLCKKRLLQLKNKLGITPKMLKEYDNIIKAQEAEKIVERVESVGKVGEVTYLPHRAVIRDDKSSTKLRIVYDASAKNNGPSLNECLYKGPSLNPLLYDILLRFRVFNYGLVADIEKAYLQIAVTPAERDYLRFLWFDDISKDNPDIVKYRFTRVIFGASPSQFLLNGTLKTHVEKYRDIDPQFTDKMLRSFYVDDFDSGVNCLEEGVEVYKKVKQRFLEGNLNVRKWRTNNEKLQEFINKKENNNIGDQKVLGITWDEKKDNFIINLENYVKEAEKYKVTKRNVLRVIAGVYDPIGFIQPIVIKLKNLFQEICCKSIDWDDELDEKLVLKWFSIIAEMNSEEIVIPRCYCFNSISDPVVNIEIHGFSDASTLAYGACIYLRFRTSLGSIKVSFVTSKSRIVPAKKNYTIPRLELLGNLLLSKLLTNVVAALKEELAIDSVHCWTDSQITLSWIRATNKEFKTFVQNRVVTIRENVDSSKWHYCKTINNPADIITRENKYINEVWWNGPLFLSTSYVTEEEDSPSKNDCDSFKDELQYKKEETHVNKVQQKDKSSIQNIVDINRFSNLFKLYRTTAYVIRFVNNIKRKKNKRKLLLQKFCTVEEIKHVQILWTKENQTALKQQTNFTQMENTLNLKEDDEGIIRSHSRLKNANIPYDTKAPIMLDREHRLTELIILHAHLKSLHRGVKQTLTELRSQYWVTRGRSLVKKVIHPCVVCKRLNVRPYSYPQHSDMPNIRFDDTAPFNSVGVDYLGPVFTLPVYESSEKLYKSWVAIYTCASTRAVILDVVNDNKATTFVNSLKRFISRRGCPSTIVSDNGKTFTSDTTQTFAANSGITWQFNLEKAPWWGGMWERLVSCVKRCIKKSVGTRRISFVELQTLLAEIELILNNRPIGQDFDDDQEDILTPNHLLFGRRLEINKPEKHDTNIGTQKKKLDAILNHFWSRWRKEYVTSLREQQKRQTKHTKAATVNKGDIVLVYEQYTPRHLWRLGRVIDVIIGRDNVIRGAKVRIGRTGTLLNRPINKLYPIESFRNKQSDKPPMEDERPKRRAAATLAEVKRKFNDGITH